MSKMCHYCKENVVWYYRFDKKETRNESTKAI